MFESKAFLQTGLEAARRAGDLIKYYYGVKLEVSYKRSKQDLVTVADVESEKVIKKIIQERFPDHVLLGEETHITEGSSKYVWAIDPIDGTGNFVGRIPYFGVSIGLLRGTKPILGIVYNPITDEFFHAIGGKAYLNNSRIKTSRISVLGNANLFVSENHAPELKDALKLILLQLKVKNIELKSSTALALCHTALGKCDAFFKLSIKNWDAIAGHYIAESAGCLVTNNYGKPLKYDYSTIVNPKGIIVANPELHKKILNFLKTKRAELRL